MLKIIRKSVSHVKERKKNVCTFSRYVKVGLTCIYTLRWHRDAREASDLLTKICWLILRFEVKKIHPAFENRLKRIYCTYTQKF